MLYYIACYNFIITDKDSCFCSFDMYYRYGNESDLIIITLTFRKNKLISFLSKKDAEKYIFKTLFENNSKEQVQKLIDIGLIRVVQEDDISVMNALVEDIIK